MLENVQDFVNFFETTVSSTVPEWAPWISGGDDHEDVDQYGLLKYIRVDKIAEEEKDEEVKNKLQDFIDSHEKATVDAVLEYLKIMNTSDDNLEKISSELKAQRPLNHFTLKKYLPNKAMGPHPDRNTYPPATYTVAVYLSTELSGGRLHFPDIDKYVDITPGSVVVYPSIFLHGSEDIFEGVKYLTNEVVEISAELLDGRNVYA